MDILYYTSQAKRPQGVYFQLCIVRCNPIIRVLAVTFRNGNLIDFYSFLSLQSLKIQQQQQLLRCRRRRFLCVPCAVTTIRAIVVDVVEVRRTIIIIIMIRARAFTQKKQPALADKAPRAAMNIMITIISSFEH